MDIRPWQPGDEAAILELFETTFASPMAREYWAWRYLDHPAGGPQVMLAWDDNRLAAHYAASRAPLLLDQERRSASLSMTTMTHPDFRGQGLFERTAKALYEQMEQEEQFAIWGFPNRNSNPSFRRKLGWHAITDIPVMSRDLSPDERFSSSMLTEVDRIDARFDQVQINSARLKADHSHEILRWRIDLNPINTYIRLVLPKEDKAGGIDGYAILKPYKQAEFDLVLMAAQDSNAYPDIIMGCLAEISKRGGRRVNTWCLPQDEARLALERTGFVAMAPVTYFGGLCFSGEASIDKPHDWRISMLDSDIY